ncbi:hypothetical protein NAEGRDRAFT_57212 [Naegleria gruberi]|uniref:Clathrin light chain n=1 Tax=Naegleria gruberi TaxID=5762 RepID=D2V5Q1_NAEGR|nr:uncharacterized protein NAEGRDRAFT_57212 [Naegleria gruberi]EFC47689.1 hypothetical protein NAEGRDRAFT_57212 [Naegleria gruberi]|eukprot:XP_002680433.1 hypothetical protein NAEGRDRAFT_57212 [Naegleria gruberi strain NEG-M]
MSDEDFFTTPSNEETQQPADEMFGDQQQPQESFDSFASGDDNGFVADDQGFDQQGYVEEQEQEQQDFEQQGYVEEQPMTVYEQQQQEQYTEPPKQVSAIREFEEKRYNALMEKDNESRVQHDKILDEAKNYKAKYIKDREERKDTNSKKNKDDEEIFRSTMETVHENVWENVMKYVDLNKAKSQNKLDKELDDMDEQILGKKKKKKNQQKEEEKTTVKKADQFDHLEVEQKDTTRLRKILLELKAEAPAH